MEQNFASGNVVQFDHLAELAKGYEKDQVKLEENLRHVYGWRDEVDALKKLL